MTPADVVRFLNDAGVIGLLVLIVLSGARGWWVYGRTYRESVSRETEWRAIAMVALELGEQTRQPDAGGEVTPDA